MIRAFVAAVVVAVTVTTGFHTSAQAPSASLQIAGLSQPVEILRDRWGINHIYAQNEGDLFFAQGYAAARDRLFQFEMWRRQATGTVAEMLGRRELTRDRGARLHQFRGDMDEELNRYHPRGKAIVEAYVRGVNAYIGETERNPALLPMEFRHARHHAGPVDARGRDFPAPGPDRESDRRSAAAAGDRCRAASRRCAS